jgi:hypothetical protein
LKQQSAAEEVLDEMIIARFKNSKTLIMAKYYDLEVRYGNFHCL